MGGQYTYHATIYFIYVIFVRYFSIAKGLDPICCLPEQYETFIYGFTGDVDVLGDGDVGYGFGVTNGTMRVVFDGVTQRAYYYEETWNILSLVPIVFYLNYTGIYDYKNNVQYRVYYDGSCDKYEVGFPLYKECIPGESHFEIYYIKDGTTICAQYIPGNATLVGEGLLGDLKISTYMFYDRIYDDPDQITMSVIHSGDEPGKCTPVRITQSDSYVFDSNKNINLSGGDVVDFKEGKVDPSVFIPPAACRKEFSKPSPIPRTRQPFFKLWKRLPAIP